VRQIPTRREENGRHSPDQARAGLPPPSSLIRNAMYAELSMTVTILPDQSGCSPSGDFVELRDTGFKQSGCSPSGDFVELRDTGFKHDGHDLP